MVEQRVEQKAILIAGPTASGKSALALRIAQQCGGYIINSDSMQVYDVLDQLTARPQPDDLTVVPHYLYGHVSPLEHYSTGHWLAEVETVLSKPELQGRVAVFTGGTGLYFKALLGGLSDMPPVKEEVRDYWRNRLLEEAAPRLYEELCKRDPENGATPEGGRQPAHCAGTGSDRQYRTLVADMAEQQRQGVD